MKTRPNFSAIPDYKRLVFIRNESRSDIYDLKGSTFRKFSFIRLSKPVKPFLIKQGAKYCIESWKNGEKNLFTGLLPFNDNIYYGDHKDPSNGRKSFLMVFISNSRIVIYYFNSFTVFPKLKKGFIQRFLSKEKPGEFPGFPVQTNTTIC